MKYYEKRNAISLFYIKCSNKYGYATQINPDWGILPVCGVTPLLIIGYINYDVQLWCVILLYDDFVEQTHGFKFPHLENIMVESITYVRRINKMQTIFISDLIKLYCLRHVSNNEVFIIRKTVQAALWYFVTVRMCLISTKSLMQKVWFCWFFLHMYIMMHGSENIKKAFLLYNILSDMQYVGYKLLIW